MKFEELETRLLCTALGNLDPIPKTMTINIVSPPPDLNGDHIVNASDIAEMATLWGKRIQGQGVVGGSTLELIATNWMQTTNAPPQQSSIGTGAEVHLSPILPPAESNPSH